MFDADSIRRYLAELGEELASAAVRGEMFIVGGAAMALAYNTRRATRDIDGVFEPKTLVYEAAARIAARHPDDLGEGRRCSTSWRSSTPQVASGRRRPASSIPFVASEEHGMELLRQVEAPVVGAVLNGVDTEGSYGCAYQSYRYDSPVGRREPAKK